MVQQVVVSQRLLDHRQIQVVKLLEQRRVRQTIAAVWLFVFSGPRNGRAVTEVVGCDFGGRHHKDIQTVWNPVNHGHK